MGTTTWAPSVISLTKHMSCGWGRDVSEQPKLSVFICFIKVVPVSSQNYIRAAMRYILTSNTCATPPRPVCMVVAGEAL